MDYLKKYGKFYLVAFLSMSVFVVWSAVIHAERDTLVVAFLDVGQGDAIFIETPGGNQILMDGGSDKKVLQELGKLMPFYDRDVDLLIMSHPQKDHMGGLVEVLKRYEVDRTLEPGTTHNIGEFAEWEKLLESKETDRLFAKRGQRIWIGEKIYLDILSPFKDEIGSAPDDLNEVMVVVKLVYGDTSFLLTGDVDTFGELRMIRSGDNLESSVLKVAHHGSKYSTSDLFLDKVLPRVAIIMAGVRNPYGHPTKIILDKLEDAGIETFRTDRDGSVVMQSNGLEVFVK